MPLNVGPVQFAWNGPPPYAQVVAPHPSEGRLLSYSGKGTQYGAEAFLERVPSAIPTLNHPRAESEDVSKDTSYYSFYCFFLREIHSGKRVYLTLFKHVQYFVHAESWNQRLKAQTRPK